VFKFELDTLSLWNLELFRNNKNTFVFEEKKNASTYLFYW